jgi:hypothetical protein
MLSPTNSTKSRIVIALVMETVKKQENLQLTKLLLVEHHPLLSLGALPSLSRSSETAGISGICPSSVHHRHS